MSEKQRLLQKIEDELKTMTEEQKLTVLVFLQNNKKETGAA